MDNNINKKYNPDVKEKYNKLNRNEKFTFSNIMWNGITNTEIKQINNSDDLKLQFNNLDNKEINIRHENELLTRDYENKILEEKKKKINKMNINLNIDIDIDMNMNIKKEEKKHNTFIELKHIQINDNDSLRKEKEKFNKMLNELESII
jgi:hypothetical protein